MLGISWVQTWPLHRAATHVTQLGSAFLFSRGLKFSTGIIEA
jgi:hypothetical protein